MAVAKRPLKQGTRRPQKRPRWSQQDLERFLRLYPKTSNLVIGKRLGRSLPSINAKAHKLRLKKHPQRLVAMGRENIALRWHKKR